MTQPVFTPKGQGDVLDILGTQMRFLCSAEQTANKWSLMEVTLPKGAGAPNHSHSWDEAYYVVEGRIEFVVDRTPTIAEAGDFLFAPANTIHAFKGGSDTPARVIIFDAPAHAGAFFQEIDAHVKIMPDDAGKMFDIGNRHGVQFSIPE